MFNFTRIIIQVIVAAAVSAAIGQMSKPFTSVLLYGDKFELNFSSAFRAGGFPSAHSSVSDKPLILFWVI